MASSSRNTGSRVLEFQTIKAGIPFTIDGVAYELRHPENVPWLTYRHYADQYKRAGVLLQRVDHLTPAERHELQTLLVPMLEALTTAPVQQLKRLAPDDQFLLIANFSTLWMQTSQAPGAPTLADKLAQIERIARSLPKTGPSPSPGSRGSTAVPRGTGSRKRR